MRGGEHPPPHVHVYYGGKYVRVTLHDLRFIDRVPEHEKRSVRAFVVKYRTQALAEWKRVNERGTDDGIETETP